MGNWAHSHEITEDSKTIAPKGSICLESQLITAFVHEHATWKCTNSCTTEEKCFLNLSAIFIKLHLKIHLNFSVFFPLLIIGLITWLGVSKDTDLELLTWNIFFLKSRILLLMRSTILLTSALMANLHVVPHEKTSIGWKQYKVKTKQQGYSGTGVRKK